MDFLCPFDREVRWLLRDSNELRDQGTSYTRSGFGGTIGRGGSPLPGNGSGGKSGGLGTGSRPPLGCGGRGRGRPTGSGFRMIASGAWMATMRTTTAGF